MAWDDGLEGTAHEIAASPAKELRVMAGPGTGKTFALMRRVARLLESGQDPHRMLVVTFTRMAAKGLVDDLTSMGIEGCDKINVSTLHSYCFRLLAREEVFKEIGRIPRPLVTISKGGSLQFEGGMLLHDLIAHSKEFGDKRECTKQILAFEAAWARLQDQDPGWPIEEIDRRFQSAVLAWLRFHQAMLIGELVPVSMRFLRDNPTSSALDAFDHVIVDEYQDLNRAEQEIIDLLGRSGSISIVGDVDQSIYSFRHAHPEGIGDFSSRHAATQDETLELCRRCPTQVVEMADHLIRHNYDPTNAPRLRPKPDNPRGVVHLVQWEHPSDEARGLAEYVGRMLAEPGIKPGDILILTPRRRLAYQLRDLLRDAGIAAHSSYREEALEALSAQRAFALLTLLNNPEDRPALRWWLGHASQTGLRNPYQKLRDFCEANAMSPWQALTQACDGAVHIKGIHYLTRPFKGLRDELDRLRSLTLRDCVADLLPENDEDCEQLREAASLVIEECDGFHDLIEHLREFVTQPEPPDTDVVRIMSLQKAKGLTSRIVIVTACVNGLIPSANYKLTPAEQEAKLQEDRRLFYVAITRCTDILVLSSLASMQMKLAYQINLGRSLRPRADGYGKASTSRFIDELGPSAPPMKSGAAWLTSGFMSD